MIGEDFARYGRTTEAIPIFMFRIGTVGAEQWQERSIPGKELPSLHSAMFAPDVRTTIETGIRAMASAALELLNDPKTFSQVTVPKILRPH